MISIRGTTERLLVLLLVSVAAIVSQANQRYPSARYDQQEPRLAYLRPLYEEISAEEGVANADLEPSQEEGGEVDFSEGLLVNALINQWLESSQTEPEGGQLLMKRESDEPAGYDINSHLPARSPFGEQPVTEDTSNQIRGPVNDPEEFEVRLSELTNALNHKMSNSLERQQLLVGLLNGSAPAGDALQQQQQDHEPNSELSENLISRLEKLLESRQGRGESPAGENEATENELNSSEQSTSARPADELPTSEYIDHPLALFGHQMVQGGAGEGRQLLGPEGTFENIQVIKSDSAIPSYCDPPNPCPLGYTAADGCIENFINSASFSREYQAKQKCSCDNEHSLFNCASPLSSGAEGEQQTDGLRDQSSSETGAEAEPEESSSAQTNEQDTSAGPMAKLDTLARTIQNRFGDLASVRKLISEQQTRQQQVPGFEPHHDNQDSNYLARSARKWSPELNYHKMELD